MTGRPVWHRRVVARADVAGAVVFVIPMLLGAFFLTGLRVLEYGMYGLCIVAVLPHIGPFMASLRRNPANLLLVMLFGALAVATAAAFARVPTAQAAFQAKGLAATVVWASIYVVVFSSVTSSSSATRLTRWIDAACLVLAASVYLSVVGHVIGLPLGEVIEVQNGGVRAFGPLGDQVGFVLVLPALASLVAARPWMVGVYVGALLLTATRGAILCLLVGVIAYALMLASGRVRVRSRLAGIAASILVAILVWASPISRVLMDRVSEGTGEGSYSMRLLAMAAGVEVARENAAVGLGFNGFGSARRAAYEDWLNPESAENGLSRTSNQYLQTATDGGVPALLLLLLFVLCTGRNAWRVAAWRDATPYLLGSQLWLVAVFAGNHGSLWLLSNTATGFFVFAVAGLAARTSLMVRESMTPAPAFALRATARSRRSLGEGGQQRAAF